jgi:hypothetical protein
MQFMMIFTGNHFQVKWVRHGLMLLFLLVMDKVLQQKIENFLMTQLGDKVEDMMMMMMMMMMMICLAINQGAKVLKRLTIFWGRVVK